MRSMMRWLGLALQENGKPARVAVGLVKASRGGRVLWRAPGSSGRGGGAKGRSAVAHLGHVGWPSPAARRNVAQRQHGLRLPRTRFSLLHRDSIV